MIKCKRIQIKRKTCSKKCYSFSNF